MATYQIRVEYLGTNFVGWQFQKNGLSIQEVLETALSKYLKLIQDVSLKKNSLHLGKYQYYLSYFLF